MIKAKINFTKVHDNDLNELVAKMIAELTDNANFPNLPFSTGQVGNAENAYKEALIKSKDGSKADTIDKKKKRNTLLKMLHDNGQYVNLIAQGNKTKLISSGYPLSDPNSPVGILDAPPKPKLTTEDTPNILKINVERNEKAKIYVYLYTPDPMPAKDKDWIRGEDKASSIVIENLESRQRYWVKVAYKTTEDTLRFSEPLSKVVQ